MGAEEISTQGSALKVRRGHKVFDEMTEDPEDPRRIGDSSEHPHLGTTADTAQGTHAVCYANTLSARLSLLAELRACRARAAAHEIDLPIDELADFPMELPAAAEENAEHLGSGNTMLAQPLVQRRSRYNDLVRADGKITDRQSSGTSGFSVPNIPTDAPGRRLAT